jgi:hypothetical protein
MSRAAKRRRKLMMMESQMMENQPLPPSNVKLTSSTKKLSPRNKILIILFILEVCFTAIFFLLRAKTHSFDLGYIIDDIFLNKLAERELYRTLLKISLAFSLSFAIGIIFHILKILPARKDNKEPSTKNFITEFILLLILAIGVSISEVIELPARFTKKPILKKEFLINKDTWTTKSGMHYDLIFSSKSSITVSKRTYLATDIGTEFYTVYQGSFLIDFFPMDKYFLRK